MSDTLIIEIKDFQSLKHVKLEVVPGVNIITGKTNQGKSAVIRAIDSALFNMGDDSMVRGGKRYSGVSIDNGTHKMVFCRDSQGKNEKSAYQFDNGAVQKKVGRSQLPEVAQMFNIRDVRMQNNTKMKINFWYQNDKPFLMDKTSGQLYEFLSLSSCDKYTRILKKMIVDMKVQEADINNITTEIDTLKAVNNRKEDFIKKNNGFDKLYVEIVKADQERKALESIESILKRIQDISSRIKRSRETLREVEKKYEGIPMDYLSSLYEECKKGFSVCSGLYESISDVNELESKVRETTSDFEKVSKDFSISSRVEGYSKGVLESLRDMYVNLSGQGSMLVRCQRDIQNINILSKKKSTLEQKLSLSIKDLVDGLEIIQKDKSYLEVLESFFQKLKVLNTRTDNKRSELQKIDSDLHEAELQLEDIKKVAGYCPFCGTVFEN